MKRPERTGLFFGLFLLLVSAPIVGCGGGLRGSLAAEVDRLRSSAQARDAAEHAPQAFAFAEAERTRVAEAERSGDETAAALYAERAVAAYTHAFVLARLARATRERADALAAKEKADGELQKLAAARSVVEREGDDLDKKIKVVRETMAPVASGPSDPAREAARLVAARSLVVQGRLLCGAAKLISPTAPGISEAELDIEQLARQVANAKERAPIDAAARARAACLASLTRARRAAQVDPANHADVLLSELSAASVWEPIRDERGVVVLLRNLFKGASIDSGAESKLAELGRVASAHPAFSLQVVFHDATEPSAAERKANVERGEAVVRALTSAGADAARLKLEFAGALQPVVDPRDTKHKGRNARVEVVFVSPSN